MIAYISFLAFSFIIYLLHVLIGFDYACWNKVVIATTVASAFFSVASFFKTQINIHTLDITICETDNDYAKSVIRKLDDFLDFSNIINITEVANQIKDRHKNDISKNEEEINDLNEKIRKKERWLSYFEAMGFMVFFIVSIFDNLYVVLEKAQSGLTMFAFVVMITLNFVSGAIGDEQKQEIEEAREEKETNIEEYDYLFKKIKEVDAIMSNSKVSTKEKENGQVENGD